MISGVAVRARTYGRRVKGVARRERIARLRRLPLQQDTICYESFAGNGALCNPEAIFRALLDAEDMRHLKHVWALIDPGEHTAFAAEFADNPRVTFVRRHSAAYDKALSTSKYLINNATFPATFAKRPGQIYLNTWHGTPLKAMGYDVPGGALATCNVVRNLLACDYLLAPNDETARMYLDAYRCRNLFQGKLIREGTPRVDRQFASDEQQSAIRARLRERGVQISDSQRILLYAPTWKGDFYHPDDDTRLLQERVATLRSRIDTERYCVLLKVHQQIYRYAAGDRTLRSMLVPNALPANDVLAATSVLVTDYSSIFIDFLATGRPVLFFAPDLDHYSATRALNLAPEQWPGPVCRDLGELVDRIKKLGTGAADDPLVSHAGVYAAARRRYCPREDGHATERVIDIVFRERTGGYDVSHSIPDDRTTLLIYPGGMRPNGITASVLSLLDNIDYTRFDVTAFVGDTARSERRTLIDQINPGVRVLRRSGGVLASPLDVYALGHGEGWFGRMSQRRALKRRQQAMRDEWVRCFGDARFDHVIDFSGYSPFWDKLLAHGGSPSLSIWLHNDLGSDADRKVAGRYPHRKNLYGMFKLYQRAHHLVSVSPALNTINRANLAGFAAPDRFTYARNTINHERVMRLAHGAENVAPPAAGAKTFVTVGRLSPEKNHDRLLRAFEIVHREDPGTRLLVIGDGPLLARLRRSARSLGLIGAVTFTGHLSNPYALMRQCDCFVLSSDYEGQPMVILEALVLGLPVISTAFASVADALPEGTGLVAEPSISALADGMRAFLRDEIPTPAFDCVAYNEQATSEFYRAIGAGDTPHDSPN